MADYRDWQLTLRLLAPLGTPMQSDTLFGHLCWQVAFGEGEQAVAAFLEPFLAGNPPFVLSDAFPAGLLPRPLLPCKTAPQADRQQYAARKKWEKAPFVTIQGFQDLVAGTSAAPQPVANPWIKLKTPHAAIDRLIDTTGPRDTPAGQFFHTESWALEHDNRLHLYLRDLAGCWNRPLQLLQQLSRTGFGRDKSTGCGQFVVESCQPWDGFAGCPEPDAFVSLSTFMPAPHDPSDGRWRCHVKRGYLGEHAGAGNPFKRPLVQLQPGAVFRTRQPLRPFYGRMVPQVAPGMPAAVQCGFTLAVPCRWREL